MQKDLTAECGTASDELAALKRKEGQREAEAVAVAAAAAASGAGAAGLAATPTETKEVHHLTVCVVITHADCIYSFLSHGASVHVIH